MRKTSSVLANKKATIEASKGLTAVVDKPADSCPIIELDKTKGSYHNSKPVKVGKPSQRGGGLGFYLVFPNLEVGKWFLLGGVSKSTR